jgi:hypothetical protein
MLNSTILDVAIGLIFTFLAMSLAVSSIVEAIASAMKWRSATLLQGIKDLLNDESFKGLALQVYNHALVNPIDSGTALAEKDLSHPPSYIEPVQFAEALMDILAINQNLTEDVKQKITAKVTDLQLRSFLIGLVERTGGDVAKFRSGLAQWFDNAMDRVSGTYKRRTQLWSFAIALIMAALMNVNSINVGRELWIRPMLARTISYNPNLKPGDAVKQFEALGVPVGWTAQRFCELKGRVLPEVLLGWLVTAFATLFGAPFWFDSLGLLVQLKGTGPSPEEKRSESGGTTEK